MVSLPPDFFLFQETNYAFPHADCDRKTSEELLTHFFSSHYLCTRILSHYRRILGAIDPLEEFLEEARRHRGIRICGEAFMRLKFVLEVIHPSLVRSKLVPAYTKRAAPLVAMERNVENYACVDVLANRVFLYILEHLKGIVAGEFVGDPTNDAWIEERLDRLETMNAAIHAVRNEPCGSVMWERFAPEELHGHAYCMFALRLWDATVPVLSSPLPRTGSAERPSSS